MYLIAALYNKEETQRFAVNMENLSSVSFDIVASTNQENKRK